MCDAEEIATLPEDIRDPDEWLLPPSRYQDLFKKPVPVPPPSGLENRGWKDQMLDDFPGEVWKAVEEDRLFKLCSLWFQGIYTGSFCYSAELTVLLALQARGPGIDAPMMFNPDACKMSVEQGDLTQVTTDANITKIRDSIISLKSLGVSREEEEKERLVLVPEEVEESDEDADQGDDDQEQPDPRPTRAQPRRGPEVGRQRGRIPRGVQVPGSLPPQAPGRDAIEGAGPTGAGEAEGAESVDPRIIGRLRPNAKALFLTLLENKKDMIHFCTFTALVLCRACSKAVESVTNPFVAPENNLIARFNNFYHCERMPVGKLEPPSRPYISNMAPLLAAGTPHCRTLFQALLRRVLALQASPSTRVRGLLDYCILLHTAMNGLQPVTQTFLAARAAGSEEDVFVFLATIEWSSTRTSIRRVGSFIYRYYHADKTNKLFYWARLLDPGFFSELSVKNNQHFTAVCAGISNPDMQDGPLKLAGLSLSREEMDCIVEMCRQYREKYVIGGMFRDPGEKAFVPTKRTLAPVKNPRDDPEIVARTIRNLQEYARQAREGLGKAGQPAPGEKEDQ
uniref:Nucleoprotein n=1 Tax=Lhasa Rhabd tick virus 1 TaxID=2972334 RepID=A0A9E7V2B8_9RHAB|nr:MAG: N protein [Lhasa Rhabd tick virus 1]WAK77227.1 MAG: N protein [Rhabdoviridae sp.]WAK77235.1 MAG: N protein [Rhabdoviridae sp.]